MSDLIYQIIFSNSWTFDLLSPCRKSGNYSKQAKVKKDALLIVERNIEYNTVTCQIETRSQEFNHIHDFQREGNTFPVFSHSPLSLSSPSRELRTDKCSTLWLFVFNEKLHLTRNPWAPFYAPLWQRRLTWLIWQLIDSRFHQILFFFFFFCVILSPFSLSYFFCCEHNILDI